MFLRVTILSLTYLLTYLLTRLTLLSAKMNDIEDLCQRIHSAVWDRLDQRVIDRAVQEWRIHLRDCVKAK